MKTHFQFLVFLVFPFFIQAQYVGIGTTTPVDKLEVKNPLRSTVRISSNSLSDTTELKLYHLICRSMPEPIYPYSTRWVQLSDRPSISGVPWAGI